MLTDTDHVVYMPLASKDTHGIVRVGNGLNITTDGLVSVDFASDWYSGVQNDVEKLKSDVDYLGKDLNELVLDVADIEDGRKVISIYQTKSDTGLVTVDKTVVGGINELKNQTQININDIRAAEADIGHIIQNYATTKYVDGLYSKISVGGNNSYVFETREQFIAWLDGTFVREDSFKPDLLNIGDVIFIEEMGVPDYWVKSKSSPMTINDFREYEAKIDIPEVTIDNESIIKNNEGALQAITLKHAFTNLSDVVNHSDFKGMTHLSEEQYRELVQYGSIQIGDEIIRYDNGTIYVTPEKDVESTTNKVLNVLDSYGHETDATKYPSLQTMDEYCRGINTYRSMLFTNDEEILEWIKNTAPNGSYTKYCQIGGGFFTFVIQKTTSSYASVLRFNYDNKHIKIKNLYAGTWDSEWTVIGGN